MSNYTIPPVPPKQPHFFDNHGDRRIDAYDWLRHRENPEVLRYLQEENSYTEKILSPASLIREKLFLEMKARRNKEKESVPYWNKDYWYYQRYEDEGEHPLYCRKYQTLKAPEEIILNTQELAAQTSYFHLGTFQLDPQQEWLAYAVDRLGNEQYEIFIKNLKTGELLPERIPSTYGYVAWFKNSKAFLYSAMDENLRPFKIMLHVLGTPVAADRLIYEETDHEFFPCCHLSQSEDYLFITCFGMITTEVYYIESSSPENPLNLLTERMKGHEYYIEHHGESFYLLTNDIQDNFRLVKTPVEDPSRFNWEEVLSGNEECFFSNFIIFENYLVVQKWENGLPGALILPFDPYFKQPQEGEAYEINFSELGEEVYWPLFIENFCFSANTVRFSYSSPKVPEKIYDFDMKKRSFLLCQEKVIEGYDPSLYLAERISVCSHDGQEIPLTLVYKKGLALNGQNFLYLSSYGAYGRPLNMRFILERVSLLERGFVLAFAHVRGGGEYGRPWYEEGKFFQKKNSFLDFIACAKNLIVKGFTNEEHLVISGSSAGGLLVGSVLNMAPHLFKAAVAHVPFMDVVTTMLNSDLALTQLEYDEWGNPDDKKVYDYLKSYSPYDNIQETHYPHVLVTAAFNDRRVTYWEPAKWIAKLREKKKDQNWQLLYTYFDYGHKGPQGRINSLQEAVLEYTFLFLVLGVE